MDKISWFQTGGVQIKYIPWVLKICPMILFTEIAVNVVLLVFDPSNAMM